MAAGFMQATSLTFIVVASILGVDTHHLRAFTAAAFVVAGLLSVILYPPIALRLQHNPAPPRPGAAGSRTSLAVSPRADPGDPDSSDPPARRSHGNAQRRPTRSDKSFHDIICG